MITLTEKRLRELESRIPIYEAIIVELKKKLDEVNTFPKDIEDFKKHCNWIAQEVSKSNSKFNELNDSFFRLHQTYTEKFNGLSQISGQIAAVSSTVNVHAEKMLNIDEKIKNIDNFIIGLQDLLLDTRKDLKFCENDISELKQDTLKAYLKGHNAQIESSAALSKTMQIDSDLSKYSTEMQKSIFQFSNEVKHEMLELEKRVKPKEFEKPKSYDNEITEIRKDIAVILSVVHSTASQVPDNSLVNDKIKTVEHAIAEIYSLLKKYQTR